MDSTDPSQGPCNEFSELGQRRDGCKSRSNAMKWTEMPEFSVEQDLPVFVGTLSYHSPKSLAGSLANWIGTLFHDSVKGEFKDLFVHFNDRVPSDDDDAVASALRSIRAKGVSVHIFGEPKKNWNVGRVIAEQCRAAEKSEHSHPV